MPRLQYTPQPPLSKFTGEGFACVRMIRGPCLLGPNGWMDQDAIWYGGKPRPRPHCVRWGCSSRPQRGTITIFGPCLLWPSGWMDEDATWCGGRPQPRGHCVRSSLPLKRAQHPSLFGGLYKPHTGRSGHTGRTGWCKPCTGHTGRTGINIQHAPAVICMDYCCPFSPL